MTGVTIMCATALACQSLVAGAREVAGVYSVAS